MSSMRDIVRNILASPIPVVGYVAPGGARAASAGTYILYATHVAAMSPGTNLGAATPVQIGGGFPTSPSSDKQDQGKKEYPTLADKTVSDSIAYIRSLAQMRGRNAEWAEKAVREAASLSAEDALKEGVIDLLASDIVVLLTQLDGRTISMPSGAVTLSTDGLTLERYEADWRTRFLAVITNPNFAYILMLIGFYGILFEFYSPGMIVPGVAGAISLLLAFYAFQILPINYAGLALILLGLALMTSEAFVPSFGALGLGGAAAFVLGSILLMDTDIPGFTVSPILIGSIATVSSGLFLFIMMMMLRARRRVVVSGPEEMIDSRAEVIDWSGNRGHVRAHGEVWNARAETTLSPGDTVKIRAIDGLTLMVSAQQKDPQP